MNSRAEIESLALLGVCHQPDITLGRFRSRLGASHMASRTEELGYNVTVYLWITIYIYIYREREREIEIERVWVGLGRLGFMAYQQL